MASSEVMKSSTSRNSDLSRPSSSAKPQQQQQHSLSDHNNKRTEPSSLITSAMTVDGILRNVYNAATASSAPDATLLDAQITLVDTHSKNHHPASESRNAAVLGSTMNVAKSVDEVWREIVSGESQKKEMKEEAADEMMTLEDFLARAGAVEEADIKTVPLAVTEQLSGSGVYAFDLASPGSPFQVEGGSIMGFGNGVDRVSGRGKRGRVMLEPLDKAAQQRQKRMIKNRESAARSRERKQAYQVELESLAVRLEEENELLLKEKAERTRERYKQLMEKVIPVVEKQRSPLVLRRVHSMQW